MDDISLHWYHGLMKCIYLAMWESPSAAVEATLTSREAPASAGVAFLRLSKLAKLLALHRSLPSSLPTTYPSPKLPTGLGFDTTISILLLGSPHLLRTTSRTRFLAVKSFSSASASARILATYRIFCVRVRVRVRVRVSVRVLGLGLGLG